MPLSRRIICATTTVLIGCNSAQAQPAIVPAANTPTTIQSVGNQWQIGQGIQAGANLFHEFQQFNLPQGQVANFLATPAIANIFSRVSGGRPSFINGRLQVTGGDANLFLINPSGIVFGQNARLDLPGAFTAITADGVEFGGQGWLKSIGSNNYQALTGNPTGYAWTTAQPGSVINAGNLSVGPQQSLTLVGGSVVNTGVINAPGGAVTIAAIPGEQLVRINQAGHLLSLELPLATQAALNSSIAKPIPAQLPELLTGGAEIGATGLEIINGVTKLTHSNTAIVSGQVTGSTVDISGERISLVEANINASVGQIHIGGDFQGQGDRPRAQQVNVDATSRLQASKIIVWSDGHTQFAGSATAKGGLVETSGKQTLDVIGARVTARDWLLDPSDITIGNVVALNTITPGTIEAALDGGTNVTISTAGGAGGTGDIRLDNSINQTAGGTASLTLTGRRFDRDPAAKINLTSTGNLTFNLNQVATEAVTTTDSIQNAIAAIGTVPGIRQINLAAGIYSATTPIVIDKPIRINGGDRSTTSITGNSTSQVIRVLDQGAELTLENTTIRNGNTIGAGGAIETSGKLTVRNSAFFNNRSGDDGGAISANIDAGDTTIDNSIFGNNSARFGGAVENSAGPASLLTIMNGSVFTNNNAVVIGGAVFNDRGGRMVIINSSLERNSAGLGGAIANADNADLTLTKSNVSDNIATGDGGGIATFSDSRLTIDEVSILRNQANTSSGTGGAGGAISADRATTVITRTGIADNTAMDIGGAIYQNYGVLSLANSDFIGNIARNGGAIAAVGGQLNLTDTNFTDNQASQSGGAIRSRFGSVLDIVGGSFLRNQAPNDAGGAISDDGGTTRITNSTIADNKALIGGGIEATAGRLILDNVTLDNNRSVSSGAGIELTSMLQTLIERSRIQNNQTTGTGNGGGLGSYQSPITIRDTTISGNRSVNMGGGLEGYESDFVLERVNLTNNFALFGGGISNRSPSGLFKGSIAITDSTIANNQATNQGGGIFVDRTSLNVDRAVIASNQAGTGGGGISTTTGSTATIINSTIAANQATREGGGLSNAGVTNLSNVTVVNNSSGIDMTGFGGGLFNQVNATTRLNNTIVANNQNPIDVDVSGNFIDQGNNLIGISDGSTGFTTSTLVGTNLAIIDPLLGALADNGGLTQTIALLPGSLAIDAGNSNQSTDQRGLSRLRAADIGAFEFQALIIPPVVVPPIVTPPVVVPPVVTPPVVTPPVVTPPVIEPIVIRPVLDTPDVVNPALPTIPVTSTTVVAPQLSVASSGDLETIAALDNAFSGDYDAEFGMALGPKVKASGTALNETLRQLKQPDRGLPAVIYAVFVPAVISQTAPVTGVSSVPNFLRAREAKPNDRLELVLVHSNGKFMRRSTSFTRSQVAAQMSYFWLINDDVENKTSYTAFGNQFYQWLMQPIEADLKQAKVQTLIYVLDQGLRQIPVATMQRSANNNSWVGNDYQMSVVASLGLLKPKISPLRNQTTVAMGIDTFKTLQPLPAVGTELDLIGRENPIGRKFLNQDFTLANLQQQITDRRPGILHLATHAQFNSGIPSKSYIQLWDRPLGIDQLKQLGLEQAGIELLVLSACNTATGSKDAELGFTGMASLSGVNTVLGSIWSVSDLGTLAFMTEFYGQLKTTPSRVEALRQTQQAMRSGQVRVDRNYLVTTQGRFPLPSKIQRQGSLDFVHPFYWAGFAMVGNPW